TDADLARHTVFVDEVRTSKDLKTALDKMWPALTGQAVVRRLLGNREALARAADGILSGDEQAQLVRRPSKKVSEEQWTRADLGLLDEADALVGNLPNRYGHIVVDEAQDLSAMELRMVGRRARRGSMTVLGDLAQATAPSAQTRWEAAAIHLLVSASRIE